MATQVSLNDGAVASAGALAIQTNGTTQAVSISTGQVATFAQNPILTSGTANGVAYLNGSKVLTTGSALTFDGTNLGLSNSAVATLVKIDGSGRYKQFETYSSGTRQFYIGWDNTSQVANITNDNNYPILFSITGSEQMRLTSTGLGIGTSSPAYKLQVANNGNFNTTVNVSNTTAGTSSYARFLSISDGGNASFGMTSTTYTDVTSAADSLLINASGASGGIVFAHDGVGKMTLDSSGNLGLGVTPSASWSAQSAFQVNARSAFAGSSNFTAVSTNAIATTAGWGANYLANGTAALYTQSVSTGAHQWYTAASGTAGNAITFTQAMTLTAAGDLGIGTTSPVSRLEIKKTTDNTALTVTSSYEASLQLVNGGGSEVSVINAGGSNILSLRTANTERARIDSSGRFAIAVAGNAYSQDAGLTVNGTGFTRAIYTNINGTASSTHCSFANGNGVVGSISTSGSTTTYSTSSDYRLKNSITPMTGALAKVSALKPVTYQWNIDGSDGEGFIAHELAEVVPQCVTGEKDAVDEDGNPKYQGIDTSFLVATLTAAIQELKAEFDAYKTSHP